MKKALALSLSIIMSMSMLCACSEDDDSSKKDKDSSAGSGNSSMVLRPLTPDSSEADTSKPDSSEDDSSKPQSDITHSITIPGHDISFGDTVAADSSKWEKLDATLQENKIAFEGYTSAEGVNMTISCFLSGERSYYVYDIEGKELTIFNKRDANEVYILDDINKTYALFPEGEEFPDLGEKDILEHYQEMPEYGDFVEAVEITIDGESLVAECFELEGEYIYFVFDEDYTKFVSLLSDGEMIGKLGEMAVYVDYEDYSYEIPSDYSEIPYEEAHANYQELFAGLGGDEPDAPAAESRYDELKAIISGKEYTFDQYLELSYDEYTYIFFTTDGEADYYYAEYPNGDTLSLLDSPDGVYLFDEEDETYMEDAGYLPTVKDLKDKAEKYFTGEFVEETEVTIEDEYYSADMVEVDGEYVFIVYDENDTFIAVLIEDEKDTEILTTLPGSMEAEADEDFTVLPSWFTKK